MPVYPRDILALVVQKSICRDVITGAGANVTQKGAKNQKFYSIFFKKSREWRGQSPFPGAHFPYFRSCPQLCR